MENGKQIKIGAVAEYTKVITDEYIKETAEWSGDHNPIHINDNYAQKTKFGKRIAHGLVCLGMVSNVVGNQLPGCGSILIGQSINYLKPVFIGDEIKCRVTIDNIIDDKIYISYRCTNQNEMDVIDGTIKLLYMN